MLNSKFPDLLVLRTVAMSAAQTESWQSKDAHALFPDDGALNSDSATQSSVVTEEGSDEKCWESYPEVLKALDAPKTNPQLPIPLALKALREQVLRNGLPMTPASEREALRTRSRTTMRGKLWKVLLGAPDIECQVCCRPTLMLPCPR